MSSPPADAPFNVGANAGKKSFRNRVSTVMRRASSFTKPPNSRSSSVAPASRESAATPPPLATPPLHDDAHMSPTPIVESAGEIPAPVSSPPQLETVPQEPSVPEYAPATETKAEKPASEAPKPEDPKFEESQTEVPSGQPVFDAPIMAEPESMSSQPSIPPPSSPPAPAPSVPEEQAAWAAPAATLVSVPGQDLVMRREPAETHRAGETPFSPRDVEPEQKVSQPEPVTMLVPDRAPTQDSTAPWDLGSMKYVETPQAMSSATPSLATKQSRSTLASSRRVSVSSEEPRGRSLTRPRDGSLSQSDFGSVVTSQVRRIILVSDSNSNGEARSDETPSVHVVTEDPFADPPTRNQSRSRSVSRSHSLTRGVNQLSPVEDVPEIESEAVTPRVEMPRPQTDGSYDVTPMPISMPLPPMRDVIPEQSVRTSASRYSLGRPGRHDLDTDETLPLLARSAVPHSTDKGHQVVSYFPRTPGTHWPVGPPLTPQARGWTEYALPDGTWYYVHNDMRVTTDINLRNPKKLEAVTVYFTQKSAEELALPPAGWEMWLREAHGKGKHDLLPVRHWISHEARVLSFSPPPQAGEGNMLFTDDDRLDVEYRYWAYMEGHPAHQALPENAHAEAMDALTWSYTDCLLPSARPASPPFEHAECQELMSLLKSLENPTERSKTQSVVHTRVVSRILMRVAQWRQSNFRPHKPLPHDTTKHPHTERRIPFRRTLLDFIVSVLCLGIPYIFVDRSAHRRLDEESNRRSAGPMLMIGACACLLAAILLSASVTFLSFPGLDDVARVSGFLTVLCSIASMVSWVISMFRYNNAEMERTVRFVGQEGMVVISKRSVVMSLPLVFLAYSIIAFVTGVTIYSFRGFSVTNSKIIVRHFDEYTKWTVVGTLGGFGGVLLTAALLAR